MQNSDFQIIIIGAGVVGLAIAQKLSPKYEILIIERHDTFGQETSSRNSEVIHSGIYYPLTSLKSKLCKRGNVLLYQHLDKYNIPYKKCGKYIISTNESENIKLEKYYNLAKSNNVEVQKVSKEEITTFEPNIKANFAFFAPNTGILNSHKFMQSLELNSVNSGATFAYNHSVQTINKVHNGYSISVKDIDNNKYNITSNIVINAAGLSSDVIAESAGMDIDTLKYRLQYCRGHYFKLINISKEFYFKHLIYPVPDSENGLLGIHLTIDNQGQYKLGPDIEYMENNIQDYSIDKNLKEKFYKEAKIYIPNLKMENLCADLSGIRPRLKSAQNNFADFIIQEESKNNLPGFINLIGIESPGLTSSLAIAEYIEKHIISF